MTALVVGLLWVVWLRHLNDELDAARQREVTLRADYRTKLQKAVSLEELKKQRAQVMQYVNLLEKQLPSKAEMDALLSDINQGARVQIIWKAHRLQVSIGGRVDLSESGCTDRAVA